VVVALVLVLIETCLVEDVELEFRAPVGDVGDVGRAQVGLRLPGNVAGIARVTFLSYGVGDKAVDLERGHLAERVHHRGRWIRHQQHVGFMDRLKATDRGAVEAVARQEAFLRELLDRNGEVLHQPGEVAESQVDDLDATLLCECQDVLRCFRHIRLLILGMARRVSVT
jgi:hypothetical protein